MRILVTGGAGFIGSAVAERLMRSHEDEIIVVDAFTYAAHPKALSEFAGRPNFRLVREDIRNAPVMLSLFEEARPDAVIHLAAESHVDRSITGSAPFIGTNVLGTHAMLEAARAEWSRRAGEAKEQFRFVHVSTDEVFGSLGDEGAFSETTAYDPSSPYSASKAAADHLVSAWGRTYGLPVITANCSNNYGPRQFPEKLIPLAMLNALSAKPIPVYGDGLNVRDWIHVEDHAAALDLILRTGKPQERYLVGARGERRNIDLVQSLCAILDRAAPKAKPHAELISYVTDRPGHDRRYAIDPSKIERDLGWRPQRSFEEGLASTVDWYLANRAWWAPLYKS
jgi:dTDP-glucose 4,6-dehydratase